eukprot:NODE_715_length_1842_cov_17.570552_g17_i35.p2 GENE.NODE_715_length_1842_cov_17.570552_g17_i35~~NODE_715_length_1842_cov_17.570552_g17_i35.p2  ORF type:complete len:193 (-),score=52.36 NODE_715_length_1842_cov_17.570552_g17_i35:1078-1656(-)
MADVEATIKQILEAPNHFALFGVDPKECTIDEIKKSYRRLAGVVHPDKCKHEQARDAFETLGKAHYLLTDEESLQLMKDAITKGKKRGPDDLGIPDGKRQDQGTGWLTTEELTAFHAQQLRTRLDRRKADATEQKEKEIDAAVEDKFYDGGKHSWQNFAKNAAEKKKKKKGKEPKAFKPAGIPPQVRKVEPR